MTEVQKTAPKSDKKTEKPKKPRQKKQNELDDFKLWLAGLGMTVSPSLHVNGTNHSMAVVAIDFGTPLEEQPKLTTEQNAELVARMKNLTKTLYKEREVSVRVQNDTSNGIWWSSIN